MPSRSLMSTQANCSDDNCPPHWFPSLRPRNFFVIKISKIKLSNYSVGWWLISHTAPQSSSSYVMNAANELTGSRPRPNKDSALTTAMVIKQTTNNEHTHHLAASVRVLSTAPSLLPSGHTWGCSLSGDGEVAAVSGHWADTTYRYHYKRRRRFCSGSPINLHLPQNSASLDLSCETRSIAL